MLAFPFYPQNPVVGLVQDCLFKVYTVGVEITGRRFWQNDELEVLTSRKLLWFYVVEPLMNVNTLAVLANWLVPVVVHHNYMVHCGHNMDHGCIIGGGYVVSVANMLLLGLIAVVRLLLWGCFLTPSMCKQMLAFVLLHPIFLDSVLGLAYYGFQFPFSLVNHSV